MRITTLAISARLENVASLFVPPEFEFAMSFTCNNCGSETDKPITFAATQKISLSDRSLNVHLGFKCKLCTRQCSMVLLGEPLGPYTAEDSPSYRSLLQMDCRGCSPVSFVPIGQFVVTAASSGTRWSDVELEIGGEDWVEYDEASSQPVGIYELKYRFETYKKKCKK